jgi:hypothetical protein
MTAKNLAATDSSDNEPDGAKGLPDFKNVSEAE